MISFLPEHYLIFGILSILSFFCINNLSVIHKFPKLSNSILYLVSLIIINFIILTIYDLPFGNIYYNLFFIKIELNYFIHIFMSIILLFLLKNLYHYNKLSNINFFEFYIIILLSFFSLVLLVSSKEIITFFFLLELQGFSFYILASFKRTYRPSIESGIKYLILSSLSSILILLGFSIVYGISGLMDFTDLYYFFLETQSNTLLYTSFLFISSGFLFKLYHFPFHFWISDIYQGSPLSSVSIFSTIPVLSIFYSFYVLIYYIFNNIIGDIKYLLFILAISTMVIGTLFALYQRKVKRLLAYSSVTNIGYITSSILNDNIIGLHNGILFICVYVINLLGIFILFLNLFDSKKKTFLESFYSMAGIYKTHKNITLILIVYLFSLAGIPPFSSFFSKLFLITSLFNESFYAIVFTMIITTFLSCFYYVRIVKNFTYNESKYWHFIKPFSYISAFSLVLLILFQIYFGLFPSMLSSLVYNSIISFYL